MCACTVIPNLSSTPSGTEGGVVESTTGSAVTQPEPVRRYFVSPFRWDELSVPDRDRQLEHLKTTLQFIAALLTVGAFIYSLLKK